MDLTFGKTAIAEAAAKWPHLPESALSIAAAHIMALKDIEESFRPPPNWTAAQAAPYADPGARAKLIEAWHAARKPFVDSLVELLSLYPAPMIVSADDPIALRLKPPKED